MRCFSKAKRNAEKSKAKQTNVNVSKGTLFQGLLIMLKQMSPQKMCFSAHQLSFTSSVFPETPWCVKEITAAFQGSTLLFTLLFCGNVAFRASS